MIAIIILVNTLFSLCHLIVRWKSAELRNRTRLTKWQRGLNRLCPHGKRLTRRSFLFLLLYCSFVQEFILPGVASKMDDSYSPLTSLQELLSCKRKYLPLLVLKWLCYLSDNDKWIILFYYYYFIFWVKAVGVLCRGHWFFPPRIER